MNPRPDKPLDPPAIRASASWRPAPERSGCEHVEGDPRFDLCIPRRGALRLGAGAAFALAMAACSNSSNSSGSTGTETATLTVWDPDTRPGWSASRDAAFAAFTEANPNISVNVVSVPSPQLPAKVQAAFASRSLPDIIYMLPDYVAQWGTQGIAAPLDDIVDELGMETFYEGILRYCAYESKTYALPSISTPHLTFYRTDLYKEKDLVKPTTWAQYLANCKALHDPAGGTYGFLSFNMFGDTSVMMSLFGCNGVSAFDEDGNVTINTENTVEALEMLAELTALSPPGSTTKSQSDVRLVFSSGGGAHMHTSTSVAQVLLDGKIPVDNFAAFAIPINQGDRGGVSFWTGWCVNEQSENKDAAKAMLRTFFTNEVYSNFAKTTELGFLPTEPAVATSASYQADPQVEQFASMFEQGAEVAKVGVLPGQRLGPNLEAGQVAGAQIWTEMMDRIAVNRESPASVASWAEGAIASAIK